MVSKAVTRALKLCLPILAIFLLFVAGHGAALGSLNRQNGRHEFSFIIHTAKPYDKVVDTIEALGGTVSVRYQNADAIAATVPASKIGA